MRPRGNTISRPSSPLWGVVESPQSTSVRKSREKAAGILVSSLRERGPASIRRTERSGSSVRRDARTQPAVPAPTMTTSCIRRGYDCDALGTKPLPTRDGAPPTLGGMATATAKSAEDGRDSLGRGGAPRGGRRAAARRRQAVLGRRPASRDARAASVSSASRTRLRDRRGAVPSRCGRAISSDCGRRSSARPSSRRRLVL